MTATPIRLRHPQMALWRGNGVLQIGVADPVIIQPVPAAAQQLVELLARAHTREELIQRLPALSSDWIDWLCQQLARAELLAEVNTSRAPIALWGSGVLAQRLQVRLDQNGLPVSKLTPEGLSSLDPGRLVVLAGEQCEPDRAVTTHLTRAGISHLVVRLEPDRAVVGPLVVPGDSSCVACSDRQLCRHDEQWPQVLAQLCAHRATPHPLLLDWATATAVTQIAAWMAGQRPEVRGRTLELGAAELRLRARTVPAHPDCDCLAC
ncbi:MAG: TOMM precursor leader peptide-binding protein [Propionibacteriales bacterium]|nr:TOMM precursor leader peptide-binding protein [Propionibacteriales bacterium]